MMMGRDGTYELIGRTCELLLNFHAIYGNRTVRFQKWRLDEDGNVEREIEKRGVLDPAILPYYPYRDDGVPLYRLIREYVTKVVKFFYGIRAEKSHHC
jgi:hypothetical protein